MEECLPELKKGRELVASSFIIPYPPGFPVLVPGQVVSKEIIQFLNAIDVSEIHGFRADLGLRVFKKSVLDRNKTESLRKNGKVSKNIRTVKSKTRNSNNTISKNGKTISPVSVKRKTKTKNIIKK